MFKISKKPTFTWPVNAAVVGDKGQYTKVSFTAEFKRVTQAEIDELLERLRAEAEENKLTDRALADELLVGFTDVADEEGQPLEYSQTNKELLLNVPGIASVVAQTFFKAIGGAREKN
jgi:hypothetical protein